VRFDKKHTVLFSLLYKEQFRKTSIKVLDKPKNNCPISFYVGLRM